MTKLSVNLNKIALLRNSRGRDFPNVVDFAKKFIALGVQGITVHPRQDERHITRQDAYDLAKLLPYGGAIEFNIEGYPSEDFLQLVEKTRPTQCTLVPDAPDQLTSDHGWDVKQHGEQLKQICTRLQAQGIRVSIFLDPSLEQVEFVPATGATRIELPPIMLQRKRLLAGKATQPPLSVRKHWALQSMQGMIWIYRIWHVSYRLKTSKKSQLAMR